MYSRKYIRPAMSAVNAHSERPTPPPDYAGITFRTSDERTLQDFPETVIPVGDALGAEPAESEKMPSEAFYLRSDGENTEFTNDVLTYEPIDTVDTVDDRIDSDGSETADADSALNESPDDPADQVPNESEPSPSPPPSANGDTDDSSSPLEWLRALKMEDFLLLWMLLMLLYGESNDEIDLLLGLLLFASH